MVQEKIIVRGAREHNLKNITVELPRNKLIVITGLSGSGKSSLAFDTIFAEGQRRYVESLSAYARQFVGQMEKPDVDQIEGLSPAISIDQRGVSANPRSTVGTVTEIYDYLRLLYARIGVPHCPTCGAEVKAQSAQQIVEQIEAMPDGTRIQVLAPLVKDRKGHHEKVFEDVRKAGFVRVRVDGTVRDVDEEIKLARYEMHTIEVVVDRLVIRHYADPNGEEAQAARSRLTDSVETALELGDGMVIINDVTDSSAPRDILFSEKLACVYGHGSFPEIEPRTFSFNSPHGACPQCQGLGIRLEIDPSLIVPNPDLSLQEGAISELAWAVGSESASMTVLLTVARENKVPVDKPWRELTQKQRDIILYGTGDRRYTVQYIASDGVPRQWVMRWEGISRSVQRRYEQTDSDFMRERYQRLMAERPCPACNGARLRPEALAVTVNGLNIHAASKLSMLQLRDWVNALSGTADQPSVLSERERTIAHQVLKEIRERVNFLIDVGLDYLNLGRSAGTLSGGEAQRIRLATQIGSQLTGVLYVLDEPSIGLHQRDNARLIRTLERMRDLGNTLLVVEHDDETMRAADWIVDLGPGAGQHGGQIVAEGTPEQIMAHPESITGAYLSGRRRIPVPSVRRNGNGKVIRIRGARENNLKNVDVDIPLGKFVVITGVSGSGKSSLLIEILYKRLAQVLNGSRERAGEHDSIEGMEAIDKVINIDQTPIGRTPRSNPATYTKMFDHIRNLFAELPESKVRGYGAGRFSFNVKGGRCENCEGQGQLQIEMQFLPNVFVTCDVCHGARYNRETLQVRYKGKNIAEVLAMTVEEGIQFFENFPNIVRPLQTLEAVGLGYIRIGQPATTLSGGEAQRIKLSRELAKRSTGRTLYVLDEPSVGLHAADVDRLIAVLQTLVDQGNTVVVIEHNLDIIKVADWLIDMGPEGGDRGGEVIAVGTPEQIAACPHSYTGQFLASYLIGVK
ncbi:MAG: excinuclease ABC subunit UvrA [Candidatus Thermofonsia Clade 1 bacterium]|uniref:UvrABC system protein A n=1 Tax=Candidatus Thermofonsia Clade 1 bacterium TaxID=2364210 RepID=A0A2M8NYY4_9CHLR|nr:MAG: excinuclease ABC subunit UvrA [Candidatus Thermofonsia Clade 1 bacterium]